MKKIYEHIFDETKDQNEKFHEIFLKAINDKRIIEINYYKDGRSLEIRKVIPFDFGPVKTYEDSRNRYQVYVIDEGNYPVHPLYLLSWTIKEMVVTESIFDENTLYYVEEYFIPRFWKNS